MTARRALCALCIFAIACAGCARKAAAVTPVSPLDNLQQLAQDITAETRAPGVRRAAWGIVVQSLDHRDRLFELNPSTLLVPASTAKLISLAAAADAVGWDFRFDTRILATAPVADGVLRGDLVVVGSGDPSIGGRAGTSLSGWIDALRASGLHRVDGRIIGDDDAMEEPRPQLAWAWDDLGYPTGVLFGALNLAENRMEVIVAPSAVPEGPTILSVQPSVAHRPLANRTVTGAAGSPQMLWPEQRPGEPFLTIAGSIPAGGAAARLQVSVGNPTFSFAATLRHLLLAGGIDVTGEAFDVDDVMPRPSIEGATLLYTHRSATLAEIAQPLLKDSINLYGEAALRLSAAQGVFPTNDAALEGLRVRVAAWGIPTDGWQIVDGSGLSRRNAVAPEVLVAMLQRMYEPTGRSPWMTGLPVAGRDGSLVNRMRGTLAEDHARAKTGTMSNVSALAGYVRTRGGETLAFAIMAENFEGPGSGAAAAIDRMVATLAAFSRSPQAAGRSK